MTTIETIYGALQAALGEFADKAAVRYKPSSDPFGFGLDPRTDLDSYYIDPPSTRSSGAVGAVESVQATVVLWLSRAAGDGAADAALGLAGDLARLRHAIAVLDVDPAGLVNVQPAMSTERYGPRASDAVTVTGRLVVTFDYEADEEHP